MSTTTVDDRCPITELYVDQCADCRQRLHGRARTGYAEYTAATEGWCLVCDTPIDPGDRVTRHGRPPYPDRYVHTGCAAAAAHL